MGREAFKTLFEDNVFFLFFFHLADKDVSWNISLFWTLSISFHTPLSSTERNKKLIHHRIIAGSDEERGWWRRC